MAVASGIVSAASRATRQVATGSEGMMGKRNHIWADNSVLIFTQDNMPLARFVDDELS